MKRFISFALILILALAAVGCKKTPSGEASASEALNTAEPAEPTAPAETPEATEEQIEIPEATEAPTEAPTVSPAPKPTAMPERPAENPNLPKVIAGEDVFFIVKPDGSLYGWGNNEFGQLGVGDTENRTEPVFIANGLVPVIVGETVFALSSDNVLWGWGRNDMGKLGTGDLDNRSKPVELLHFVKEIADVGFGCFALTESGELYFWGYTLNFTSEDEAETVYVLEPELAFENVTWFDGNYAIKSGGELWQKWGNEWRPIAYGVSRMWNDRGTIAFEGTDGRLYTLGNREGLIGEPNEGIRVIAESFRSVTVSDGTIWVLTDDGSLYYYKAAYSSILGSEEGFDELTYVMNEVVEFAADTYMDEDWGYDYKFALKANGDLWAWGEYSEPALGKTEMSYSYEPECVAHGVRSFTSTGVQTYLIAEYGCLWATGYGADDVLFYGSLGDGTTATRFGFVKLDAEDFRAVTSRMDYEYVCYDDETDTVVHYCRTFAVDAEGSIWAWGWNGDGLLGTGSAEEIVLSPEEIIIED